MIKIIIFLNIFKLNKCDSLANLFINDIIQFIDYKLRLDLDIFIRLNIFNIYIYNGNGNYKYCIRNRSLF